VEVARIPVPEYAPPRVEDMPDYRINFGDVLEFKFFNNDRFNETVTVRPDGRISLQRLGDLLVLGRTPEEVDSVVTAAYAAIIISPDVTVFLREFGQQVVYVLGEVDRPGEIDYRRGMTLLQAVALAGGPNREAKMSSVLVIRQDQSDLVAARWDMNQLMDGRLDGGDPRVMPYDVIYIPQDFISRLNEFVDAYLPAILMPLDLTVRWFYYQRLLEGQNL
jgi:protein involved in polysaccharide export with SLBB domain